MKHLNATLFSILLLLTFSANANSDVSGSNDNPLISRYPETHIIKYSISEYDQFDLPAASIAKDQDYPPVNKGGNSDLLSFK
ncbi:MAG: hypothetical protein D6B27_10470 [Gammaproteobacteria bacterium]|nr:MAG: hypothetical protein D6B27_10470 [Gammaproteobacteria bacterium]